jgi:putative membrane protein
MKAIRLATVALISTLVAPALAKQAALSPQDKDFIVQTAQDSLAEIELAHLAEQRATSPAVKEYAKHMISDHTDASNSLKELALGKGIDIPTQLDAQHQAIISRLSSLNGRTFDVNYADQMVKDHQKVVSALKTEADRGESDLRNWSRKTLPTIQEHLKMAETIDHEIKRAASK